MSASGTAAKRRFHTILTFFIATIWMANGLFCKVLNLVPRHGKIVAVILGTGHSRLLTILIGLAETAMAIWVVSNLKTRLNAIAQMIIVAAMNIIEFISVPSLLLWGRMNAVFALVFIVVIYYNEFILHTENRNP